MTGVLYSPSSSGEARKREEDEGNDKVSGATVEGDGGVAREMNESRKPTRRKAFGL